MTPQEAIERISQLKVRPKPDNALDLCALIMAKKALEKQILCKPVEMSNRSFVCGKCKQKVIRHQTYCDICGQALDWE
jgi:hypothetical protein